MVYSSAASSGREGKSSAESFPGFRCKREFPTGAARVKAYGAGSPGRGARYA